MPSNLPDRDESGRACMVDVLISEDDPEQSNELASALEATHKFRCHIAHSVKDAVNQIVADDFDLVSTDLNFPEGDTGYVVIPPARQKNPHVGVLVFTTYGDRGAMARYAGADEVLVKPVRIDAGEYVAAAESVTKRAMTLSLSWPRMTKP